MSRISWQIWEYSSGASDEMLARLMSKTNLFRNAECIAECQKGGERGNQSW